MVSDFKNAFSRNFQLHRRDPIPYFRLWNWALIQSIEWLLEIRFEFNWMDQNKFENAEMSITCYLKLEIEIEEMNWVGVSAQKSLMFRY